MAMKMLILGINHNNLRFMGNRLVQLQNLRVHRTTHAGDKKYKLEICVPEFVTKKFLAQHMTKVHPTTAAEQSNYLPTTNTQ